ncbi:hypothetical protein ABT300_31045 [Streptomyces sp. NPDC001027]|uniref:hypothetical protein n=1 Tax=Streptomyces sp. NPDC001027 TaxID=3154771 RepID=UPI00332708E5
MHQTGQGLPGEDYARLPEDLLTELLTAAPAVTRQVEDLLGPALQMRDELREAAHTLGMIERWPGGRVKPVAAVDGGFAVERTVAIDLALSVAVGVEGFPPDGHSWVWNDNQYSLAHHVLAHGLDNERLARAGMAIQELDVLADTPHEVRIYDGSHLTPVIQLNAALASRSEPVRSLTAQLASQHGLVGAFGAFVEDTKIVAMPKYNSSRTLCDQLETEIAKDVPCDDKYVTSLILEAGEYTTPQPVPPDPWRQLHVVANPDATKPVRDLAEALHTSLRNTLREHKLYTLYFRPSSAAPAYRIEVKPDLALDTDAVHDLLASIAFQLASPFLQEPYPQYLADVMAKSVGFGIDALQAATHLFLARQTPELAQAVIHSYRTEGK